MNSIISKYSKNWHERIKTCYDEYKKSDKNGRGTGKVSQAELARRINAKYCADDRLPHVSQVTISRWLKFGANDDCSASLPPIEAMVMLADFFGVNVGHLLGETSYKTFEMADAAAYLGLSERAIEQIRLATRYETSYDAVRATPNEASEAISTLISSKGFFDLVIAFNEMDRLYNGPDVQKELFRELEKSMAAIW